MFNFKNVSIKTKLVLMQVFTATVVLSVFAAITIFYDMGFYRDRLVSQISAQVHVTGVNCIPALEFNDPDAAYQNLEALSADKNIRRAWITDSTGNLFTSLNKDQDTPSEYQPEAEEFVTYINDYLILSRAINQDGTFYGYVAAWIDTSEHQTLLMNKILISVALLLAGFFVVLIIAVIVQKSVSDPISHLTKVVNNVRETGDLTFRFTAHKNDEIGVLSSGLSNMLQEINHLHSQLEERVKERTSELEQQRNRFKNLTVNLPAMIYQAISDSSGNMDFVYVSPTMRELYELTDDEMEDIQKALLTRVHPDDLENLERSNEEVVDKVTPWHGVHRIIVPSGKTYWVEGASNPVQQADGTVLWDGLLLDITARKMGEQNLMLSEARLEEAQRIANIGNWEWSVADEELFWSKEAYRIFGFDPDSETVSYAAFLKIVHPDDCQAVMDVIEEARSKPGDYHIEHRIIMPGPSIKYLSQNIRTEFDVNGNAVRMIGTTQDISERYLVQQELKKSHDDLAAANEKLRHADRIKSIFLASMSHELRTPLNSIIGFTSIMLQGMVGEISEEQKKQLGMVKKSADHLLELINDVLDISKIEAGQIELNLEDFALEETVGEVVGNLKSLADKKGVELIYTSESPVDIYADKRRIKQIVFNLAGNGIKFTSEGKVTVTTRPVGKQMFEIQVSDTGIGIKEDDLFRLFQPFQQVDDSLTKKFEGTGLGLYLSKKLVNLLGGEISVESVYGEGSTFTVRIPRVHKGKAEQ